MNSVWGGRNNVFWIFQSHFTSLWTMVVVGLNKDQQQSLNDFSQNGLPSRGRHEKLKCTYTFFYNHKFSDFLSIQLLLFQKCGFLQESPILWCIEREQKKLVVLCCNGIVSTQTLAIERSQCFWTISLLLFYSLFYYIPISYFVTSDMWPYRIFWRLFWDTNFERCASISNLSFSSIRSKEVSWFYHLPLSLCKWNLPLLIGLLNP